MDFIMNFGNIDISNLVTPHAMYLFFSFVFLIHLAFAVGVFLSGTKIRKNGKETWIVSPLFWACATFLIGPIFSFGYWFIHYSSMGSLRGKES